MTDIFVTGMLRSGTTLIQILLTNHPGLFVAYQPYHQLYVDIKQLFLDAHGLKRPLPLGDGLDTSAAERTLFDRWLRTNKLSENQISYLVERCATGKGGGASKPEGAVLVNTGTFFDIQHQLHALLASRFGKGSAIKTGAKEVLCEEFVPGLVAQLIRCLLIIRDPRAVIASACHGSYRQAVGDHYPLLMLIRLWRKSAAYWLGFKNEPLVCSIRYEDLLTDTDKVLARIASWLAVDPFSATGINTGLLDHEGKSWKGNSSFGDKVGIDSANTEAWRTLLSDQEVRFIEACTNAEMRLLGYQPSTEPHRDAIVRFRPDESGVRESYNKIYACNKANIDHELLRWDIIKGKTCSKADKERVFVLPDIVEP